MSWLGGVPSNVSSASAPEAPVTENVHTDDSPSLTKPTVLVIDHDEPKSLRSEGDFPISPKYSVASSEGGSGRPRPNLKVYTRLKPNIPQGTTATIGPPDGGSDTSRQEASSDFSKPNVPKAPLHRRGRSVPPYAPDSTVHGGVHHDEFEAYKREAERTVLSLKQQMSVMAQDAQKKDSDHAIELKDREYQNNMLKDKLEPKGPGAIHPGPLKASVRRKKARSMPKQPILYIDRRGRNNLNAAGSQNKIQYLYEGLVDRLRQATVEIYILRAEMAQRRKDWPRMYLHANEALDLAEKLNYMPMNARCLFYRGIAQFHLRKFYDAADDLEISRTCIGIYRQESEITHWVHQVEEAQGVASANPSLFARFRNSFSRSTSKIASIPESRRPSVPPSRGSIRWRNLGGAIKDEIGSAIMSAAFSAEWPSPSPQAISHPTPNLPDATSSPPAQSRPLSTIERNRASTTASEAPQPRGKRSATLAVPSFGTRPRVSFDSLKEREALRERIAARRPPAKLDGNNLPS